MMITAINSTTGVAHGGGILVRDVGFGDIFHCVLKHGVVIGSYMYTFTCGTKVAATCGEEGAWHGPCVWFYSDGKIDLDVYNNGKYVSSCEGYIIISEDYY